MKFTVTPLGGGRGDTARVVDSIVRYLHPPLPKASAPTGLQRPPSSGPEEYYADKGEEPGRWLGRYAQSAGLIGAVGRDDFASVLAGRDPHTGERLITAQGSAGRRPMLGAGEHSRIGPNGELLFDLADVSAALEVTRREATQMLDAGVQVALRALTAPSAAASTGYPAEPPVGVPPTEPGGAYLVPVIDPDGTRWVSEAELSRCQQARDEGASADQVRSLGAPGDQLPISEAARLSGVTTRYLRELARHHELNETEIAASVAAGRQPRRAYLRAQRGTKNRWLVTREYLAEFLERRRPPAVRVAYDLTLTTEKSLGVLALLGDDATRSAVLGSIRAGNDWALGWIEDRAVGRIDGKPVPADGLMVASFQHLTSRALDPFPHHHNVVMNTVIAPDGSHRSLWSRCLYQHAHAASALATAEMRHQLSGQLDVRWRPSRRNGWEIEGIGERVVSEFSQRRGEIDDALRELEAEIGRGAHPGEVEHIVLRTRPAKNHTPADELIASWCARATECGLTRDDLDQLTRPAREPDTQPDSQRDLPATVLRMLTAEDGVCAGGSVFTRADAIAAIANIGVPDDDGVAQPLLGGASQILDLTDGFLTSGSVIQLTDEDDPLFTTAAMLEMQNRITSRFRTGRHEGSHPVTDAHLAAALQEHEHLTEEQRSLVASWCQSGHRYQAAIGRAGTGKTTTVAACADAWRAAGYRVLGAAVKGEAARTLAAATGIECETVAWYLAHTDPEQPPLDAKTILIVDEASTLHDQALDTLMDMASRTGATIRLVGDPAQHGAIAAGGMFRVLCERHPRITPELTTSHRLQHPQDRAAAEALRQGDIDRAFDHLSAAGHLHIVGDDLTMYRQVLARWWDAHRSGQDHPMVDRRNSTRRQLNLLAHLLRAANGELGDEIPASGNRTFAVGDRVTARAPNRNLYVEGDRHAYVRNGALGTITAVHHDGSERGSDVVTVDFDGIGSIDLPRTFFDRHQVAEGRPEVGIDHAYAVTSYAVQGSTRAVSTSRVDATATRSETYVDITRGRKENHLYLTTATDPLDGEALPRVPASPADVAVADRLHRSTGELTAWEIANPADGPAQGAIGR